ncbi:MAG: DNA-binding response regulator [Clostridiales bacterium 38-18]|nr:MAG: DNA-binding response regulator [Clostridiales bacterium 38-18]
MSNRILIVEDQSEISDIVSRYLEREGYQCLICDSGLKALEIITKEAFQLLILDVMLPGINGFEILKTLRQSSNVPVILLTAKIGESDRIQGFDYGADDYVTKPFSPKELVRRVSAILRRTRHEHSTDCIILGAFKLCQESMKLYKDDVLIDITTAEYQMMRVFMLNAGNVLTRDQLIASAFGYDYEGFDRNIDSYVKRLRQKIESDPKNPVYLKTKYGMGYVFGGS